MLVMSRLLVQLYNIYGVHWSPGTTYQIIFCIMVNLFCPIVNIFGIRIPFFDKLTSNRITYSTVAVFGCLSLYGLVSIFIYGISVGIMNLTALAFWVPMYYMVGQDNALFVSPNRKSSLFVSIIVQSFQLAACQTFLSSVLPVYTVPITGVLFSKQPCNLHMILTLFSLSLWIVFANFIQNRFQICLDFRRQVWHFYFVKRVLNFL